VSGVRRSAGVVIKPYLALFLHQDSISIAVQRLLPCNSCCLCIRAKKGAKVQLLHARTEIIGLFVLQYFFKIRA